MTDINIVFSRSVLASMHAEVRQTFPGIKVSDADPALVEQLLAALGPRRTPMKIDPDYIADLLKRLRGWSPTKRTEDAAVTIEQLMQERSVLLQLLADGVEAVNRAEPTTRWNPGPPDEWMSITTWREKAMCAIARTEDKL